MAVQFTNEWNHILTKVAQFTTEESGFAVWFRGERDSTTQLHSGLLKMFVETREPIDVNRIQQVERNAYLHFNSYGASLHNQSGWGQVCLMQHHGMPTRLLDWSESFAVALFFAVWRWTSNKTDARIWMLRPSWLNQELSGKKSILSLTGSNYRDLLYNSIDYRQQKTTAVTLPRANERIIAQQGRFTLQGLSLEPLESEKNGDLLRNKALGYIDLPYSVKRDAMLYLRLNGINEFSMFPDLDGLSAMLKRSKLRP